MLFILSLSILTLICIIAYILFEKAGKVCLSAFSFTTGIISFPALVFLSISLIDIDREFKLKTEEYHSFKEVLHENRACAISPLERVSITREIIDYNNMIIKNRIYSESLWLGLWYSKDIGSLELLK